MEDPKALRDTARRWRQLARFHDASAAIALASAASQLEAEAERLDGGAQSPARATLTSAA